MYHYTREPGQPWWSLAIEMWLVQKSLKALLLIAGALAGLVALMALSLVWILRHMDEFPWGTTAAALAEVDDFLAERGWPGVTSGGPITFVASWLIWAWFWLCLVILCALAGLALLALGYLAEAWS